MTTCEKRYPQRHTNYSIESGEGGDKVYNLDENKLGERSIRFLSDRGGSVKIILQDPSHAYAEVSSAYRNDVVHSIRYAHPLPLKNTVIHLTLQTILLVLPTLTHSPTPITYSQRSGFQAGGVSACLFHPDISLHINHLRDEKEFVSADNSSPLQERLQIMVSFC